MLTENKAKGKGASARIAEARGNMRKRRAEQAAEAALTAKARARTLIPIKKSEPKA